MNDKPLQIVVVVVLLLIVGMYYFDTKPNTPTFMPNQAIAAKFDILSKNGNSSYAAKFTQSIDSLSNTARLQGLCCSLIDRHRYNEQFSGLQKYKDFGEIPSDPYDIDAGLAKKLKAYYDVQLTPDEQRAYDYAMTNSMEKGPCCCQCWRWYVYDGLGKLLIQQYHFTGEQVTEIWNLSAGCGGAEHMSDHNITNHTMQ